jgi:alanine racemase
VAQRAVARIRSGAIEHNCARLREGLADGAELCAVVKADGYGHGAVVAARAALAGGASWLAVATAAEAAELREAGIGGPLLVMGALTPEEMAVALDAAADVVAWNTDFVRALATYQGARPTQVHVKLDTGMGRLGTEDPREAWGVARRIDAARRLRLAGVMTHFATADELGDDYFPAQLERFSAFVETMRADYVGLTVHAANSAATLRDKASHFDMVRCGVAIYGLDPFQQDPDEHGLEPALELESYVAAVKKFKPGQSAGYGRRWTATEPTWVGVLPIGYGDGWRRALTNNCEVLVGGRRRPLVGTVSMDNVTVDLGADPEAAVGDPAILIGRQGDERITAEEVARRLDTINYEVTCGLTRRIPRAELP